MSEKERRAPLSPDVEDFKFDITDESFNSLPDINVPQAARTNTGTRRELESSSTQSYLADDERKKQRKEHKRRDKIKSIKNRRVFRIVWWAMVILVALSFASYLITGSNDLFAVGRKEGSAQVVLPKDVTLDQLTDILTDSGVIKTPEFFKLYCGVTTDMEYFKSGTFEVRTNMDYEELINYLQAGASREVVQVTFREGLNVEEIAALLEENGVCSKEDALNAIKNESFDDYDMIAEITNKPDKYYQLEGYLFPDTYDFYKGEEPDSALKKMLYNFQQKITKELQEEIVNSGMTRDQIITLASLIEAEAADVTDMYRVSAVLHNRLDFGAENDIYYLECDSSYYYPYRVGDEVPAGYVSRYSTNEPNQGLPAGAINNPGIEAIKAALRPDSDYSDALYFCHSADGTAYYASNLDAHINNQREAGLIE